MDKKILQDYIDACELIKETEQDIAKLRKKKKAVVMDSVKGSMQEFPYAETSIHIEGTLFNGEDDAALREEEKVLSERKAEAEKLKIQVQEFMNTIPMRKQRIIRFKLFEGLSWEEVADKMGRNTTGDSLRMELNKFIKMN